MSVKPVISQDERILAAPSAVSCSEKVIDHVGRGPHITHNLFFEQLRLFYEAACILSGCLLRVLLAPPAAMGLSLVCAQSLLSSLEHDLPLPQKMYLPWSQWLTR